MTTDRIALQQLLEKGSDTDLLREMIAFVAERLMALEVESLCGAAPGERTAVRTNHRNGFRDRPWDTRAGSLELTIPKLRKGCLLPGLPRAQADRRESAHRRDPGGLRPRPSRPARSTTWSKHSA